jgi:hypothetical protein
MNDSEKRLKEALLLYLGCSTNGKDLRNNPLRLYINGMSDKQIKVKHNKTSQEGEGEMVVRCGGSLVI